MREVVIAPLARDLRAERPTAKIVPIPNATTATLRAWDALDGELWEGDPQISVYSRAQDVPNALRGYLVVVQSAATALLINDAAWDNQPWAQYAMIPAGRFLRVRLAAGGFAVLAKSAIDILGGDRPVGRRPVHEWDGVPYDLGGVDTVSYGGAVDA